MVAQPFFSSCGNCEPCAKGEDNVCADLQFMGAHADGGFAQYVKVSTRKMYRFRRTWICSWQRDRAGCCGCTRREKKRPAGGRETALIIGGGPIGMLIAMIARRAGARQVVISEISSYRRRLRIWAFVTVDPTDSGFDRSIETPTEERALMSCFEVSGTKPGIGHRRGKARITGTIVVVGMTKEPHPVDLSAVFAKERPSEASAFIPSTASSAP